MDNPHAGHRDRLKKQYQAIGLDKCSDLHLLEMLLFYAIPVVDTNVTAHLLLDKFKNLSGVLSADREEILSVRGVGESVWLLLHTIDRISDRIVSGSEDVIDLSDKKSLYDYFYSTSYSAVDEYISVVFLNYRMEVISNYKFSCGKENPFVPDQKLKKSFEVGEKYCVAAHIKPDSSSDPESEDMKLAYDIAAYVMDSGIELKEFFVIGKTGIRSAMYNRLDGKRFEG